MVFWRDGALAGQAFDPGSLELSGDVFRIVDEVGDNGNARMMVTAGPDGMLLYGTGFSLNAQFTWMDRTGKQLSTTAAMLQRGVALSPDGSRIAVSRGPLRESEIWLRDTAHDSESRFTSPPLGGQSAVWSPDGRMLAFMANDGNLYRKDIAGGKEELILKTTSPKIPSDWSRDGRYLLYSALDPKRKPHIWVLPNPGGAPGESKPPFAFQQTEANESLAQFSPDGRWVAYDSDESGRREIYVRPFPSGPGRWKVSTGTAWDPRWRSDGKELYYLTTGERHSRLMAVPVMAAVNGSFAAGEPKPLFEQGMLGYLPYLNFFSYSPAPDGQRFLVLTQPEVQRTIHLLTNWTEMMGRRNRLTRTLVEKALFDAGEAVVDVNDFVRERVEAGFEAGEPRVHTRFEACEPRVYTRFNTREPRIRARFQTCNPSLKRICLNDAQSDVEQKSKNRQPDSEIKLHVRHQHYSGCAGAYSPALPPAKDTQRKLRYAVRAAS